METGASKILGCIIGGACGDALGYPVEHKKLWKIIELYGEKGICEMVLENGIAQITDDTQMTIYTAQGLIHAMQKQENYEGFVKEVHLSYLRWIISLLHNKEEMVSLYSSMFSENELAENDLLDNEGIDVKMCRGGSTFSALLSGNRYSPSNPAPEGVRCGTIMRSAPIGIFAYQYPELAFRLGSDCGALTHGDPSAYLAAGFMCMLLSYLLQGCELEKSIYDCLDYLQKQDSYQTLFQVLMKAINLAKSPSKKAIDDIQCIGLGWRADENLAICLYCLLRFRTNVKEGFIACVNHDGDSDSVGAVYGNLAGAYVGLECLPAEYVNHVQFKELLMRQATFLSNTNKECLEKLIV